MRVVVTGATGFIGAPLIAALRARGDRVVVLTRDVAAACARFGGDVEVIAADLETAGAWQQALAGADAIVHLAGEPIAGRRWDARQKQRIRDSRTEAMRMIVEAIAALAAGARPRVVITASAVDYYAAAEPPLDDDEVTEADPPADTFLGRVCRDWEREAKAAEPLGVRVVRLRFGLVLGPGGGALARMTRAFRSFAGGRLGGGAQWVSWIHRDDAIGVIVAALGDDRYTGAFNAVAPEAVRNSQLAKAIGLAMRRPSWLPVPAFALRAALGEMAEAMLHGRRCVPARLRELDYAWKHPTLAEALVDCV